MRWSGTDMCTRDAKDGHGVQENATYSGAAGALVTTEMPELWWAEERASYVQMKIDGSRSASALLVEEARRQPPVPSSWASRRDREVTGVAGTDRALVLTVMQIRVGVVFAEWCF